MKKEINPNLIAFIRELQIRAEQMQIAKKAKIEQPKRNLSLQTYLFDNME